MTILLQVQLLPSSPSPDEKSLKQKKRPPEGSLFLERKTRLERRLACVCLSRTPLSRLRRQLPRGAVASPSPDEKSLKQKRDHPKAVSSRSGKRDSNASSPASAFHVLPSVGCADSSLGEQSRVRVRTKSPSNKKRDHPKAVST